MSHQEEDKQVYCTVNQIASDPSFCFTVPMLRYYILHSHRNGLSTTIRKIGKKVVLRKDLFIKWIENQSAKGGRR